MIKFYYNTAPNPMKVALCLEEMGLPYEAIPLDTRKGEQHAPAYLKINPNAKAPSITDDGKPVFDSNGILLYLAEKTGQFKPKPADMGEAMSWMMFIASGIGPFPARRSTSTASLRPGTTTAKAAIPLRRSATGIS